MRRLRVYSWIAHISAAQRDRIGERPHVQQARASVAARSQAEAARLAGYDRPSQMFNLGETGNAETLAACLARPGVVLLQSMGGGAPPFHEYNPRFET